MIKKLKVSPLEQVVPLLSLTGCSLTNPRVQGQCCQNRRDNSRGDSALKLWIKRSAKCTSEDKETRLFYRNF